MQILDNLLALGTPQILLVTARRDEIPEGMTHVVRVERNQVVAQGLKNHVFSSEYDYEPLMTQSLEGSTFSRQFSDVYRESEETFPILIEMHHTHVAYGNVAVLQDITWTMRQGENWAILGPNGAGKTTLLSLILADNPRSYANQIRLFGRQRGSGESIWEIKRRIGWVAPELQIYYHEGTICEHVVWSGFFDSIGLYRGCSPEQVTVARQWMQAFDIAHLADHPFGTVSVGEQRRVLLARALVKSPILLVLDEPCQGLDGQNRTRILQMLDQLCKHTLVNLIYVTHHWDEMPDAITHVLRLESGQIQNAGTRNSVFCETKNLI